MKVRFAVSYCSCVRMSGLRKHLW